MGWKRRLLALGAAGAIATGGWYVGCRESQEKGPSLEEIATYPVAQGALDIDGVDSPYQFTLGVNQHNERVPLITYQAGDGTTRQWVLKDDLPGLLDASEGSGHYVMKGAQLSVVAGRYVAANADAMADKVQRGAAAAREWVVNQYRSLRATPTPAAE